eukprot:6814979-Alexandrium_andersonii.AAC.1
MTRSETQTVLYSSSCETPDGPHPKPPGDPASARQQLARTRHTRARKVGAELCGANGRRI